MTMMNKMPEQSPHIFHTQKLIFNIQRYWWKRENTADIYIILKHKRELQLFSTTREARCSRNDSKVQRKNSRRIHGDTSLIDGRQVDSYCRLKEMPVSIKINVPDRHMPIACMYFVRMHIWYNIDQSRFTFPERIKTRDGCLILIVREIELTKIIWTRSNYIWRQNIVRSKHNKIFINTIHTIVYHTILR